MQPLAIIADDAQAQSVIADAGSIVKLADQSSLYRDRVSPITMRADEILVWYGKPKEPRLGWLTNKLPPNAMKPTKGPTFLVTTQAETAIHAWDLLRLKVARTRKTSPHNWFAPWLVLNGKKFPREVREVTRLFGGKPIKNEEFNVRCSRLFHLILNTEFDMSAANAKKILKQKKGKKVKAAKEAPVEKVVKKSKKVVAEKIAKKKAKQEADAPTKKAKKKGKATTQKGKNIEAKQKANDKPAKKGKAGEFRANNRDHDDWIVKRLTKDNPRREGTYKASVWDILKKGMSVKQFVEKGGGRTEIQRYIENGWVKLLRPSASE